MTEPSSPPQRGTDRKRPRQRNSADDRTPLDVDDLAAAADGQLDDTPVRHTVAQFAVASIVAAVVVMLLVFATSQWIRIAVIDAAIGAECTGPDCVEEPLSALRLPGSAVFPPGTTVISSRYSRSLHDAFITFQTALRAGNG